MSEEGEDEEEDNEGSNEGFEPREGERKSKKKPAPNAAAGRGAPARAALAALASSTGLRVLKRDKHSLNMITNNAAHQGVVLECGALPWERAVSLLEAEEERKEREGGGEGGGGGGGETTNATTKATPSLLSSFSSSSSSSSAAALASNSSSPSQVPIPVWLVLDQVADPQNLGAILRSALFLGASGVLLSPKNCAPASAAASKASAGALEWLRVSAAARPLPALLREAAQEGNWAVLGADAGNVGAKGARATARGLLLSSSSFPNSSSSSSSSRLRSLPPKGIALVLGSEGAGLRPVVAAECTAFVKVESGRNRRGETRRKRGSSGDGGGRDGSVVVESVEGAEGERKKKANAFASAVGTGEGAVDSLNVSVAAALLLHDLLDVFGGSEEEEEE